MKKLSLIILLLAFCFTAGAVTRYVSTSGTDSGTGQDSTAAWKTLAYAETNAQAGDVIALKRGDTWTLSSTLIINQGGSSASAYITWDGNVWGPGASANATVTTATLWLGGLFVIRGCDYVILQNIIFDANDNNSNAITVGGISSSQNDESYITIQDCEFYDVGVASSIYGILVETYVNGISHITIQRNIFDGIAQCAIGLYGGRSDMGAVPAWTTDCYVGYNTIYNFSRDATGEAMLFNNGQRNHIVEHNIMIAGTESADAYGLVFGSNELYYEGQAGFFPQNITVRYNEIRTVNRSALFIQGAQALTLNFYYNKFLRESIGTGGSGTVRIIDDENSATYEGALMKFYNNIMLSTTGSNACFGDVTTGPAGVCDLKNNIFYNSAIDGSYGLLFINTAGSSTHSYNSYWRPGGTDINYVQVGTSTYYSRYDSTAWEPTGVWSDPKLANVAGFDYRLLYGSHCINEGTGVSLTSDYAGTPISGVPDIGVYEYGAVVSPIAPTVLTSSVTTILTTTATAGGNVTSQGGASVTTKGVCWSTTSNPTVTGTHTTDGPGEGAYTSYITGLTAGTTYHVRAYATNSEGTAYGSDYAFTTTTVSSGGSVTKKRFLTL